MADVFLSYQKKDRALAARIADALRDEGLSVWWDDDITPRESWDRTIEREIAAADHVLVLWTKNSVESDWVRIEGNYARNCQPSKLVQARFDDAPIPMAFSMVQYVDLATARPDRGPAWRKLVGWLELDEIIDTPRRPSSIPERNAPRPPQTAVVPPPMPEPEAVRRQDALNRNEYVRVQYERESDYGPSKRAGAAAEPLLPYAMFAPDITRVQALRWLLVGAALFVAVRCVWVKLASSPPIPVNIAFIAPLIGLPYLIRTREVSGEAMRFVYFIGLITIANAATIYFNFKIGFAIYTYFPASIWFICGITGGAIYGFICFVMVKVMRGVPESVTFGKEFLIVLGTLAIVGGIILHTSMILIGDVFDYSDPLYDIAFVIILYGGWHGTAAWGLSRLLAPPDPA